MITMVFGAAALLACCGGSGGGSELTAQPTASGPAERRPALEDLGGREWVLRFWTRDEPAPVEPEVTLNYADGRFHGSSGCNSYFHDVEAGDRPGDIVVGPGGATKMYCPDPAGSIERRFSRLLGATRRFDFLAGKLALSYEIEGESGVMIFEERERKEQDR